MSAPLLIQPRELIHLETDLNGVLGGKLGHALVSNHGEVVDASVHSKLECDWTTQIRLL